MTVALDTNVLAAAFLGRGVTHDLLEYVIRRHTLVTSDYIIGELQQALLGEIEVPKTTAAAAEKLVRSRAALVREVPLDRRFCRDPDDDRILALAALGEIDCLVTGDEDLLSIGSLKDAEILRPGDFWDFEIRTSGG